MANYFAIEEGCPNFYKVNGKMVARTNTLLTSRDGNFVVASVFVERDGKILHVTETMHEKDCDKPALDENGLAVVLEIDRESDLSVQHKLAVDNARASLEKQEGPDPA